MTRHVEVLPYHKEWSAQFEEEARLLRNVFADQVTGIYHFGSTAIPGISAKPIIDILLTVRDIQCVEALGSQLAGLGYVAVGEYGIAGRRFFYKGTFDLRTHHLHVYQQDNPHILRHVAFRDYLRTHPIPARQYSRLKENLALRFPEDMDQYIAGKSDFVKQHEREALEWWSESKRSVKSD
jgi:GrpB-like predicted nucleotidyltransferase (UPF0157 family)